MLIFQGVVPTNAEKMPWMFPGTIFESVCSSAGPMEMSFGTPHFLVIVFRDPTLPFQGSKFGDIEEWRTCRKQYICVISIDCVCVCNFNICIAFAGPLFLIRFTKKT